MYPAFATPAACPCITSSWTRTFRRGRNGNGRARGTRRRWTRLQREHLTPPWRRCVAQPPARRSQRCWRNSPRRFCPPTAPWSSRSTRHGGKRPSRLETPHERRTPAIRAQCRRRTSQSRRMRRPRASPARRATGAPATNRRSPTSVRRARRPGRCRAGGGKARDKRRKIEPQVQ